MVVEWWLNGNLMKSRRVTAPKIGYNMVQPSKQTEIDEHVLNRNKQMSG